MKRIVLLSLLLVLSGGCVQDLSFVKPDIIDSLVFASTYDTLWAAIVESFAEKSLPIKTIEKDSGIIATEYMRMAAPWHKDFKDVALHPNVPFGTWYHAHYKVNIFVTTVNKTSTKVKINVLIEAFENNLTDEWHTCYSKGIIEQDILEAIRSKIEGKTE